jgi:hypothetical protein
VWYESCDPSSPSPDPRRLIASTGTCADSRPKSFLRWTIGDSCRPTRPATRHAFTPTSRHLIFPVFSQWPIKGKHALEPAILHFLNCSQPNSLPRHLFTRIFFLFLQERLRVHTYTHVHTHTHTHTDIFKERQENGAASNFLLMTTTFLPSLTDKTNHTFAFIKNFVTTIQEYVFFIFFFFHYNLPLAFNTMRLL